MGKNNNLRSKVQYYTETLCWCLSAVHIWEESLQRRGTPSNELIAIVLMTKVTQLPKQTFLIVVNFFEHLSLQGIAS